MPTPAARLRSLWPFGAIFSLELRQLARRPQTYATRVIYLGLLLAFLSFSWLVLSADRNGAGGVVQQAQRRAETGETFFRVFGMFSVIAMHLIGPVLTAASINSERTRRTLDTLLMTPITAWQIAAGKLMSRLWTAIMLLALSLPLLAIVRLLGGVELSQVIGTLGLCAATALGSAAIGLLFSALVNRMWGVVLLAYLVEFSIYFLLPVLIGVILSSTSGPSRSSISPGFLAATNPMSTTGMILMGRGMLRVDWWPAIVVQVGLALGLTALTAAVLRRSARVIVANPPIAELLPIETKPSAGPPPLPGVVQLNESASAVTRAGREVSDQPVLWHELRRPLMTRPWQRVTGIVLTLGMLILSYFAFGLTKALSEASLQIAYAFIMQTLLLLIAIVISATVIATEKESDTWTTLIATPLSARAIVYGKFIGTLRRLLWPWALVAAHFSIFAIARVISPMSWLIVIWTTVSFTTFWIATGLYLSLRCRRSTTAVVLNLLLPIVMFVGVPMILSSVQSAIQPHAPSSWYEIVDYYLPYFYTGQGITKPGGTDFTYLNTFMLPLTYKRVSITYLPLLALASGLLQLALTQLMLMTTCRNFDRMVGRARTVSK